SLLGCESTGRYCIALSDSDRWWREDSSGGCRWSPHPAPACVHRTSPEFATCVLDYSCALVKMELLVLYSNHAAACQWGATSGKSPFYWFIPKPSHYSEIFLRLR